VECGPNLKKKRFKFKSRTESSRSETTERQRGENRGKKELKSWEECTGGRRGGVAHKKGVKKFGSLRRPGKTNKITGDACFKEEAERIGGQGGGRRE